ncbi:unnamed protein product, partial [Gulo gulo]
AAGGGGPSGGSGVRRKLGKSSPGSGDLTYLTTEPNRIWNPGNQAPIIQRQPPAQLICLEILKRRICLCAASQVQRLQAEESAPCKL